MKSIIKNEAVHELHDMGIEGAELLTGNKLYMWWQPSMMYSNNSL